MSSNIPSCLRRKKPISFGDVRCQMSGMLKVFVRPQRDKTFGLVRMLDVKKLLFFEKFQKKKFLLVRSMHIKDL